MKNRISNSIGFKILFFYTLLSLVNISFVISIIFENQVDLISKNIKLETENQLSKLVSSMKKFTYETQKGTLFETRNYDEALNQIIKFIGPHFDGYMIITEKGVTVSKSAAKMAPPKTLNEDVLRTMTARDFSGNEYYLRVDEASKKIYCYISLSGFNVGNYILLLQKDIGSLNVSLRLLYHQAIYVIIVVLLFHIIFAIILFRYIIYPINLLNDGAKRLSDGNLGARINIERKDEFHTLAETFNRMAGAIDDKIKTLSTQMETVKESKEKIENLAIKDELTGLYNRGYLIERAVEELKRTRLNNRDTAFLIVDLDRFNEINKIYGHQTGNIILTEAAKIIARCCTAADVIGRFGGEEFAVLSPEASKNHIRDMAEQIRATIEKNVAVTPDGELSITVSIGISYIDSGSLPADGDYLAAIASAETALQHAKENGRNRVEMIP